METLGISTGLHISLNFTPRTERENRNPLLPAQIKKLPNFRVIIQTPVVTNGGVLSLLLIFFQYFIHYYYFFNQKLLFYFILIQ